MPPKKAVRKNLPPKKSAPDESWRPKLVTLYHYFQKANFAEEIRFYARDVRVGKVLPTGMRVWRSGGFWDLRESKRIQIVELAYRSLLNENAEFMKSSKFDDLRVDGGVLYHFFDLFDDFYDAARMDLTRTGWFDGEPGERLSYAQEQAFERGKTIYVTELSEAVATERVRYVAAELELGVAFADREDDDWFEENKNDIFLTELVEKAREIVSKGLPSFDYAIPFWWNEPLPESEGDWDEYVEEVRNRRVGELQSYWNDAPEDVFKRWGEGEPEKPGADVVSGKNRRAVDALLAASAAATVGILGRYEVAHKSDDREKTIVVYNCFQKVNFMSELRSYGAPSHTLSNFKLLVAGSAILNLQMWNSPAFWKKKASVALVKKAYVSLINENSELLSKKTFDIKAGSYGFFGLFYAWSAIETFRESTMRRILEIDPSGKVVGRTDADRVIAGAVATNRIRFLCREWELEESEALEGGDGAETATHLKEITDAVRDHAAKLLRTGGPPTMRDVVPFFWNEDFPKPVSKLEDYWEEIENRSIESIQDYWNTPEDIFLGRNARV